MTDDSAQLLANVDRIRDQQRQSRSAVTMSRAMRTYEYSLTGNDFEYVVTYYPTNTQIVLGQPLVRLLLKMDDADHPPPRTGQTRGLSVTRTDNVSSDWNVS